MKDNTVAILSIDVHLLSIVQQITSSLGLKYFEAEDQTDIYAIGAFCFIIDSNLIDKDFMSVQQEMLELENPKKLAMIFTSPTKFPVTIKKFCSALKEENDIYTQIRTKILNLQSYIKNQRHQDTTYTKKLNRLFAILRHLQTEGNYLKVLEKAEEYGVSEKTIKRDIQFLKEVGGEDIRYDITKQGYVLDNSYFSVIGVKE